MAKGITVNNDSVTLSLKGLKEESVAVLPLAHGAYLIMRSDILAAYPRQHLRELSRIAQAIGRLRHQEDISFTPRKKRALQQLSQQNLPISDGLDYDLQTMAKPNVNLESVQQSLSTMKESLSEEVIIERQEQ